MNPTFTWPYASPDFLHMTGSGGADLPVSTFGVVTPYSGNVVMGFVTWLGTTPEFREYLSVQFTSPMVPGTTYTIGMWITNGSSGWYCGYSSNRLGLRFSMSPLTQIDHEPVGGTPQCEYAAEVWSTGWQYITFTYVPDQPYNYVTIGNFYTDAATAHTYHAAAMSAGAYYFIDEVVVMPAAILPITLADFFAEERNGDVDLSWFTQSEDAIVSFEVERSPDGITFTPIGNVDADGGPDMSSAYAFTDTAPEDGINYYRLKMESDTGIIGYSNIESVVLDKSAEVQLTAWPNPCRDVLHVDVPGNGIVRIFDLAGHLVYAEELQGGTQDIPVSNWLKGLYLLKFEGSDKEEVIKLVID